MATKAQTIDDMEVTHPVERDVTAPHETAHASIDPFVHPGEGFPGGLSDRSVLTGYANHVAFRLWHWVVYILYVDDVTLFINDTLKLTNVITRIIYI